MENPKDHKIIINAILGNNNHISNVKSIGISADQDEVNRLRDEVCRLKTDLMWAKNQLKIKSLLLKKLL